MSKITSILSNHQLNTSNVQKLASAISTRLQATIAYGYSKEYTYFANKNNIIENFDTEITGVITYSTSKKKYTLVDTQFQNKEFIKTYGFQELEKPLFKKEPYYKEKILEAQKGVMFYLLDKNEDIMAEIYRDTIILNMVDFLDWTNFKRIFIYKNDKASIAYLNKWRIKNRRWVYAFGGHHMFIFNGENASEFIYNEVVFKTEKALKSKIAKKLKGQIVNMSNYLKVEAQLNKPDYVQPYLDDAFFEKLNYSINNNLPFTKIEETYPCVVYDDFQDLKNSLPILEKEFDFIYDASEVLKQIAINKKHQDSTEPS